MANWSGRVRRVLLAGTGLAALAASGANAAPYYQYLTSIAIPVSPDNIPLSNANNKFTTYDIADVNSTTHMLYLADRSNAAVDIFNTQTLSYVGRIGGSSTTMPGSVAFSGQKFNGSVANNAISGPDGVQVGANQVFVGNGDSTLKGFTLGSNTPTFSTNLGGVARTDELAFDPTRNYVLAVNNADTPPFFSVVNGNTGAIVKQINFNGTNNTPNATLGGLEAPAYDAVTGKYYVNVVQVGTSGPGAVSEIDPANGFAVTRTFDLASSLGANGSCAPTGLVAGNDGRLLVGCGSGTSSVLLDPRTSAGPNGTQKVINGISGEDQVYYDTSLDLYYTASRNDPKGPLLGIITGDGTLLQSLSTTAGDHSVAVDSINHNVFVAAGSGSANQICPNGCILVYSTPEPSSLPLLGTALLGLVGMVGFRVSRR